MKIGEILKGLATIYYGMLVNIGIAVGLSIVVLFATALTSKVVFGGGRSTALLQFAGMITLAYLLFNLSIIGLISAIAIAALPVVVRVISFVFVAWIGHRAMSGAMGKEAKWAAELVREEDTEFRVASQALPSYELREVSIIAESKQELRDLTIERYEEYTD